MKDRNMTLLLDALFLARKLTYMIGQHYGDEKKLDRLIRIAGKAWSRYDRRTHLVEGIRSIK